MNRLKALGYIFLAIAAHGFLLLTSAQIWDGWLAINWIKRGRIEDLTRFLDEVGKPVEGFIYQLWSFVGPLEFVSHMTAFIVILATGWITYRLLADTKFFSESSAAFIGATSILFPIVKANSDFVMLMYLANYFSFLAGLYFAYLSIETTSKKRAVYRTVAYIFLLFGFLMNSLLVYYFTIVMIWFFSRTGFSVKNLFFNSKVFLKRNWDLCILPLLFWICKKTFSSSHGQYINYNSINFDFQSLKVGYYHLFVRAIAGTFLDIFAIPPGLVLSVIIFSFLIAFFVKSHPQVLGTSYLKGILASLCLALTGALPYILVGQYAFDSFGWATKNNILLQLPLAIFFVQTLNFVRKIRSGELVARLLACSFLILSSLASLKNYLRWEAESAIEHSLALYVSTLTSSESISVVQLGRKFDIPETFEGAPAPIVISEWLRLLDPRLSIFCTVDRPSNGRRFTEQEIVSQIQGTTVPYALDGFDLRGSQVRIDLKMTDPDASSRAIAFSYLSARLHSQEKVKDFLENLTTITVQNLN